MEIRTDCGILDTKTLPDAYDPCFCGKCGCRVGWFHTDFGDGFIGLCDDCAAVVSQDNGEDPMKSGEYS